MSEHITLVKQRQKEKPNELKKQNLIPAVVYRKDLSRKISLSTKDALNLSRHLGELKIITLKSPDFESEVLVKDIQFHPVTDQILHIDFFEIKRGEKLRASVGVSLSGTSPGVKLGGVLEVFLNEVSIEALPRNLPHHISVDISGIEIGQSLHVRDIPEIEGVRYLEDPNTLLLTVSTPRAEEVKVEEEVKEVAVIEKGKKAEEEEGAEEEKQEKK